MVKGKRKPFNEIKDMVKNHKKVLIVGCGGCVSVCYAGGLKEVGILCDQLNASFHQDDVQIDFDGYTVERQCNQDLLVELDNIVPGCDALLSMACGAGCQYLAERFPAIPVYPAINTMFIGVDKEIGIFEERCRACGDCVLGLTGGICPVTRCAKSLFNGPCGGTNGKNCEVSKDIPCAWLDIYERLKAIGQLDNIKKIKEPMQWKNTTRGTFIQEGYEDRYLEKEKGAGLLSRIH
ncbi:Methylene-tetrahydrofolate reductase C terminal domain-containing protein [Desulfonema limicola]|uniref:Methylene-tetrahydrofolate reductase C terminal domain-containing protein n=1 Tax=Desulfonema limicola TaxID=45656 RepID=A0A975BBW7_9BACT|nr:methylenetetrahydrofolate reductase C-terminal domain-containing protein [Desulfonema limicola]QTA82789.1 Methylene-tetrahydrofolate reductase C terminal domain-containing protein [Desulfonema limicola]